MKQDDGRTFISGPFGTGLVLVTLGVCGFLDAAGAADWSATVGAWWPLALVAWAAVDMAAARAVSLKGLVWTAIGVALLADVQEWASDVVVWSSLAVFVGLACMAAATLRLSGGIHHAPNGHPTVHDGAL